MEFQFQTPARVFIAGPSGCGKTTRLFQILEWNSLLFDNKEHFDNIFYFYNTWNKDFDKYGHLVTEFINEYPSIPLIEEKCNSFKEKNGSVVVIDDFGSQLKGDIVEFFTVKSHHLNISVFFLHQNLFPRQSFARDITLNTTDTIIFKNPRDPSQIRHFATQFKPGKSGCLVEAYNKATTEPYSYLWINQRQAACNNLRVLTNVTPDEWPPYCFIDNE